MADLQDGYIKLYRSLIRCPIFDDERLLKIWIWCLLKANHTERDVLVGNTTVHVESGQFVYGRIKAAEKLKIPESTLYRKLKVLKNEHMIELKVNNKWTVVSIVNWVLFQDSEQINEHQNSKKRTSNEHQMNTNKNDKECKESNKNNVQSAIELFESLWKQYPNKKGKGQVSESKKKVLLSVGYEEMSRAIERYVNELKKESWRKPQNGSTFFNSGYVDYLDKNFEPSKATPQKKNYDFDNKQDYDFSSIEEKLLGRK